MRDLPTTRRRLFHQIEGSQKSGPGCGKSDDTVYDQLDSVSHAHIRIRAVLLSFMTPVG